MTSVVAAKGLQRHAWWLTLCGLAPPHTAVALHRPLLQRDAKGTLQLLGALAEVSHHLVAFLRGVYIVVF